MKFLIIKRINLIKKKLDLIDYISISAIIWLIFIIIYDLWVWIL